MIEQGATTYIVKPFNLDQLVITIENLLSDQFLQLLEEKELLLLQLLASKTDK